MKEKLVRPNGGVQYILLFRRTPTAMDHKTMEERMQ